MTKMTLKTEGDTHIIVTRRFAAPPEAVYRAHTDPKLIQKWLLGPEGWTMPVCINEARPGGKIRYEWTNGKGGAFHLTGEYLDLEPYRRIVHVERMHLPDPTPDNHIETRFDADGTGTLMTMRMTLPDAQTRAAMLATGMERGMEASYVRLEGMIYLAPGKFALRELETRALNYGLPNSLKGENHMRSLVSNAITLNIEAPAPRGRNCQAGRGRPTRNGS